MGNLSFEKISIRSVANNRVKKFYKRMLIDGCKDTDALYERIKNEPRWFKGVPLFFYKTPMAGLNTWGKVRVQLINLGYGDINDLNTHTCFGKNHRTQVASLKVPKISTQVIKLLKEGLTVDEIAKRLVIEKNCIYRAKHNYKKKHGRLPEAKTKPDKIITAKTKTKAKPSLFTKIKRFFGL